MNRPANSSIKRRDGGNGRPDRPFIALLAASGILLAGPGAALELGDIDVQSTLGQPLRASIAYALAPNEQLSAYCIYVRGGNSGSLPQITRSTITVTNGRILLRGNTPLREPMMSLQLAVECNYTPHLTRNYLLMFDPAPFAPAAADAPAVTPQRDTAPQVAASPVRRPAAGRNRRAANPVARPTAPVDHNRGYVVQPGDTLSTIAARIPDRQQPIWPTAEALFEANPGAFIDGDINQLRAGATLAIPAAIVAPAATATTRTALDATPRTNTRTSREPARAAASPRAATRGPAASEPAVGRATAAPATAATSTTARESASPFVEPDIAPLTDNDMAPPVQAEAAAPATPARSRENASPVPIVGNRVSSDGIDASSTTSWMLWFGGAGIAIILGLLLFGRSLRERIGGVLAVTQHGRRRTDHGLAPREDSDEILDMQDTLSRAELFSLDANLVDGTGFDSTADIDVAEDYSFASSDDFETPLGRKLDLEFSEASATEYKDQPTDMIPPPSRRIHAESTVIVDKEVLPGHDDGTQTHYDMSMILDATKQNFGDAGASTRDLRAVAIEAVDKSVQETGNYTLNDDLGYQILEQDYEEELTATQALNREISEAARKLSENLGEETAEVTAAMPASPLDEAATVETPGLVDREAETAEMPALQPEDAVSAEMPAAEALSSAATAELPASTVKRDADSTEPDSMARDLDESAELTAEMPVDRKAGNDDGDTEISTLEIAADQDDETVEMENKTGRRDQRKAKAS
ncbi:MAG: hypothetical protein WD672_14330 [Woeseia sp.]